ncbi:hypothetical protein K9M79_04125 [Candidatus Woesearchaeota archaeon]|nr:hypothetical protein [Candidatus Woesearchaeota archaeon]
MAKISFLLIYFSFLIFLCGCQIDSCGNGVCDNDDTVGSSLEGCGIKYFGIAQLRLSAKEMDYFQYIENQKAYSNLIALSFEFDEKGIIAPEEKYLKSIGDYEKTALALGRDSWKNTPEYRKILFNNLKKMEGYENIDIIIIIDEPYLGGWTREELEKIIIEAKEIFPNNKLAVNYNPRGFYPKNQGPDAPLFEEYLDYIAFDMYPANFGIRCDDKKGWKSEIQKTINFFRNKSNLPLIYIAQGFSKKGCTLTPEMLEWSFDVSNENGLEGIVYWFAEVSEKKDFFKGFTDSNDTRSKMIELGLKVKNLNLCGNGVCNDTEPQITCMQDCSNFLSSGNRFGVFPPTNPENNLDSVIELGVKKTRFVLSWDMFEPKKGEFNFDLADLYLNKSAKAGITPIITIKSDSSWGSRSGSDVYASSPPINMADYEKFLTTVVNRYKDKIKFWQIENEVYDNSRYWNGTKEEYIELLKNAYNTIKRIDPEAQIVLQGFPNMMLVMVENKDEDVIEFFDYIMKNGEYFDVIDFHQYYTPETVYLEVKVLKNQMNKYGYNKPLICTEAGGPDLRLFNLHRSGNESVPIIEQLLTIKPVRDEIVSIAVNGVTEQEMIDFARFLKTNTESRPILEKYQAEDLVKRICLTLSQGVELINWLAIMDFIEPVDWYTSFMGLQDTDGRKKPHFYTYKLLIDKLENSESISEVNISSSKMIKFTFIDKEPIFVLWSDEANTTIDLSPYLSPENVKITHIVTYLDGNNQPIYPKNQIVSVKNVPVSSTPIFVEAINS